MDERDYIAMNKDVNENVYRQLAKINNLVEYDFNLWYNPQDAKPRNLYIKTKMGFIPFRGHRYYGDENTIMVKICKFLLRHNDKRRLLF